jgi:Photosystem I reaction centre subunit N (PSAN or PSI-N)
VSSVLNHHKISVLWMCSQFDVNRKILMQELNDKKRLATSGANFARAYTVEFGTCKFPYNFTGCQDLAKQKVQLYNITIIS